MATHVETILCNGHKINVFTDEDGTYGNAVVGFGFPTLQRMVAAYIDWMLKPAADEWAGIARGMKSGAL